MFGEVGDDGERVDYECATIQEKARAVEHEIPRTAVPEAPKNSRRACERHDADGDAHFTRCLCEDGIVRGRGVEVRVCERRLP